VLLDLSLDRGDHQKGEEQQNGEQTDQGQDEDDGEFQGRHAAAPPSSVS
jgi:hypothetical protein